MEWNQVTKIAALLFTITGFIFAVRGLTVPNDRTAIPLACMWIIFGMAALAIAINKKPNAPPEGEGASKTPDEQRDSSAG